ncbi:hypothetical protein JCGZ_13525 [Jatropha curcas]|uniref:Aminotransferase-like plant mobile domain-containing protein n=1 Tax=Jatropha curcas TaxID=180498 RepID=A0A067KNA3_JATCU|nr:hypothetical protein JCGZ_13525 [Jatropha curcas]
MRGFQTEVDLGKARAGGSSTDASTFRDLLDPPMRSRVVVAGFSDYAARLCHTQPRFPPAMCYTLMERCNDCTHTFIFGFGEMTLTPADYTAVTGLGFDGAVAPLDARYQTAALGAELLLCTSQNKGDPAVLACLRDLSRVGSYDSASLALAHLYHGLDVWTRGSGESNWQFSARSRCGPTSTGFTLVVRGVMLQLMPSGFLGIWLTATIPSPVPRIHITGAPSDSLGGRGLGGLLTRAVAEAFTRSRILLQEGMTPEDLLEEYDGSPVDIPLSASDYATYFSTRLQARRRHRTPAYYRAQAEAETEANAPAGPAGAVLGDVPFPPGMEVMLDPALGLGSAIIIPADLKQAPPPLQLDPEHATHVPAQRYQELYQRFRFAWSYIARLYPELHERIGRLRRHQSRQFDTITRLQMEVDRLRTRLEVEGIPLDLSEDEEDDDDDSLSDDAPPPPPSQAVVGPSRRRR